MVSKLRLKTVKGSRDIEFAKQMEAEGDLQEQITTITTHRNFNSVYSNRSHASVPFENLPINRGCDVGTSTAIYTKDKILISCHDTPSGSYKGRVFEFKRNPTNVDNLGNYVQTKATLALTIGYGLESQEYIRLYDSSGSLENFVLTFSQDTMSGSSLAYCGMPESTFTQVAVPGSSEDDFNAQKVANVATALRDAVNASSKVKITAEITDTTPGAHVVTFTQDDSGPDGNTQIYKTTGTNRWTSANEFAGGDNGFEWVVRGEIGPWPNFANSQYERTGSSNTSYEVREIDFGQGIQVNDSGYLAVGAMNDIPLSSSTNDPVYFKGALYIFKSSSSGWQKEARLTEGFWGEEFGPHTATGSFGTRRFGRTFALHPEEPLIAVSQTYVNNEPSDGNIPDDFCFVDIWRRSNSNSGQQEGPWVKEKRLTALNTFNGPGSSTCFESPNDQNKVRKRAFGHSLEFSGSYLAVGGGYSHNGRYGEPGAVTPESILTEGVVSIFKNSGANWTNIANFKSSYAQEGKGNHYTPKKYGPQRNYATAVDSAHAFSPYSYGRCLAFLPGNKIVVSDHYRAHKFHSPQYINSSGYDVPESGYSTGSVEILSFQDNGDVTLLQTLYSKKLDDTYETAPGSAWRINQHQRKLKMFGEEIATSEDGDTIAVLEGFNFHYSNGTKLRNLYVYKLNTSTGNFEPTKRIFDQFNIVTDFSTTKKGLQNGGINNSNDPFSRQRLRLLSIKKDLLLWGSPHFGDTQLHWGNDSSRRYQTSDQDSFFFTSVGKFSVSENDVSVTQTSDTKITPLGLSPLNVNTAARLRGQSTGNSYTLTIGKTK